MVRRPPQPRTPAALTVQIETNVEIRGLGRCDDGEMFNATFISTFGPPPCAAGHWTSDRDPSSSSSSSKNVIVVSGSAPSYGNETGATDHPWCALNRTTKLSAWRSESEEWQSQPKS